MTGYEGIYTIEFLMQTIAYVLINLVSQGINSIKQVASSHHWIYIIFFSGASRKAMVSI